MPKYWDVIIHKNCYVEEGISSEIVYEMQEALEDISYEKYPDTLGAIKKVASTRGLIHRLKMRKPDCMWYYRGLLLLVKCPKGNNKKGKIILIAVLKRQPKIYRIENINRIIQKLKS